jgi:predicted DNA-binding protein (MmcQ/YjbR family)
MQRDRMMAACQGLPGAAEEYPFGDEVAVFKVGGKMFALVLLSGPVGSVSVKCDPAVAVALRGQFAAVTAGYHLNKRHWNTVALDDSVPDELVEEWLEHSYELVVRGLPKAQRERLAWRDLASE